ncbi:hypothetical protein [Mucilaginibacter conchicola]|uniref:hypothetical protein n=1 Tax=Mucilaginibacter conchicola TaxID=2303333 RepID=UPI0018F50C52|nr:hypothetical protein [Mucilaginibacter conchicola]
MTSKIENIEDVRAFLNSLVDEGVNAHPDELFENYINTETGADTYTPEQAVLRNRLMKQSFEICEKAGTDLYDAMQEIFLSRTGADKYIPLPSSLSAE